MKYVLFTLAFISFAGFSQERGNDWKSFPSQDTNSVEKGKEGIVSDVPADSSTTVIKTKVEPGSKTIIASEAIMFEDKKYTEYSKANPQIKGFTILLYSGSGANSRLKAREVAVKFQEQYPDGVTHVSWKSPNYEVRMGDYRTKIEAQHDLEIIKEQFPTAFIKSAMIELPPLEKMVLTPIEE